MDQRYNIQGDAENVLKVVEFLKDRTFYKSGVVVDVFETKNRYLRDMNVCVPDRDVDDFTDRCAELHVEFAML
jgi:hypothetical protein